jgi:SAM-dependent methyltransferase
VAPEPIAYRDEYHVGELLAFNDVDFVRSAYRALLRREPDVAGSNGLLVALYAGELSKVEILGVLHESQEGRNAAVRVHGLANAVRVRRLRRIPILGRVIGIVQYILRLPMVVRNLERQEVLMFQRDREVRVAVSELAACVERASNSLSMQTRIAMEEIGSALSRLEQDKAPRSLGLTLSGKLATLDDSLARLANESATAIARLDAGLGDAEARLEEVRRRLVSSQEGLEEVRRRLVSSQEGLEEVRHRLVSSQDLLSRLEASQASSAERVEQLFQGKADREDLSSLNSGMVARLEALSGDKAGRPELQALASGTAGSIADLRARVVDFRRAAVDQEKRLALLMEEARKRLPRKMEPAQVERLAGQDAHLLDALYAEFEDRFRGSREDIAGRVSIYVPVIREAGAGRPEAPVLDVGPGRGEWLEVLRENELAAQGVDTNGVMVQRCRDLGLQVFEGDAIEYLRSMKDGSLGAVTGIHVIEHIPFRQLLTLFDEALRVLRPGGVIIFETPNPENVVVGSCNFWYDPTHLKPLPPEAVRFMVEARGFVRARVERLHPVPAELHARDGGEELRGRFNQALYGPQDYSIIAYKS